MTRQTKDILTILGVMLFAAIVLVFGPIVTIWALNTLFPALAIPYSLATWAAVIVLNLTALTRFKMNKE